ncbi:MAG TPA: alpha/beta fold hydrolase [Acidimicrobiales bacterium]|nr:alpha/beta fold hydrolase [Acidimicrobiales bacterium]
MPPGALVLHGFTGTPASVAGLADALAAAGFEVAAPLLPGHGGPVEDVIGTGWADWSAAAEAAYQELAARASPVVVAGLSMGGALACQLAADHAEIAGLICVNPAVEPVAESFFDILRGLLAAGVAVVPSGMGADVARPGGGETGPGGAPLAPLVSMFEGVAGLAPRLGDVACPLLLFTSVQDHVVAPSASDLLADRVAGPVERVWLERSFHVATMDFEAEEIERRSARFATEMTEPATWVVAGCLFEVSLPGSGWRWVGPSPAVTLVGEDRRDGRHHFRFRAEAPGSAVLVYTGGYGGGGERSLVVRIAPESTGGAGGPPA